MNSAPTDDSHWSGESLAYDVLHERARVIAQEVISTEPESVLELGCSTGQLMRYVLEYITSDYYGTDISQQALDRIDLGTVIRSDLNKEPIPFAMRSFDCIACSGVLEYIDDIDRLLGGLALRCNPGGTLIVSYVNRDHVVRRAKLFLRRGRGDPTWRQLIPLRELIAIAESAGFRLAHVIPVSGAIQEVMAADVTRHKFRTVSWFGRRSWRQVVVRFTRTN